MLLVPFRPDECVFCCFRKAFRPFSTSNPARRKGFIGKQIANWRNENENALQDSEHNGVTQLRFRASSQWHRTTAYARKKKDTTYSPTRHPVTPKHISRDPKGVHRRRHGPYTPETSLASRKRSTQSQPSDGTSSLPPPGTAHKSIRPHLGQDFDRTRLDTPKVKALRRLAELEPILLLDPIIERLGLDREEMKRAYNAFKSNFEQSHEKQKKPSVVTQASLGRILKAAELNRQASLDMQLKYAFYGAAMSSRVTHSDQRLQEQLLNLNYPGEWYPRTRGYQRTFHVHVGPTNSGKTYHALKRLEEAASGVYAGPLRLLAHEVYMRLNAKGKPCNLITGDDRKKVLEGIAQAQAPMVSCTVEMLPLYYGFEVAVIDEIQMLASEDRGWAWTQAVLGVMAKEVHVCGEERSVPIIEELASACGDKVIVHRYERLSPLQVMPKSLEGNLQSLQKGDCVVGFSIVLLHSLRQHIEQKLQKKCAIIYGSLPPETRAQQASLFNEPDNDYDFLVASNAIGMGLNLNIKRLIFQAAYRNVQGKPEPIPVPEIKQIAGRAGRYSTASADMKASTATLKAEISSENSTEVLESSKIGTGVSSKNASDPNEQPTNSPTQKGLATRQNTLGYVTTLEKMDHPTVANAMRTEPWPIQTAGILPPDNIIEKFSRYFPSGTPLAYLLMRISDIASTSHRFHVCDLGVQIEVADIIEPVQGLTIADRLTICSSPLETRKEGSSALARAFASLLGEDRGATVLEIKELDLDLLDEDVANQNYLQRLEQLHKGLIAFIWLSYRFTNVFLNQDLAFHTKELVEKRIEETLGKLSFDYNKLRKSRDQALLDLLRDQEDAQEPETKDQDASTIDASSPPSVSVHGELMDHAADTPDIGQIPKMNSPAEM